MLIIGLNINDFGGTDEHLANYKKINYYRKECFDWATWRKIPKTHIIDKLKEIVLLKKPTVFILQEFELNNSKEPMDYIIWMKKKGYTVKGVMPSYKVSMTLFFVKDESLSEIAITHSKTGLTARDYAIKIKDYIIYGTHVPLNSDKRPTIREDYWDEIIDFYDNYKEDKLILLGDFNTYNESSEAYKRYQKLLEHGAYDLWLRQGKPNSTPTELKHRGRLDYIFISPSAEDGVIAMDIDTNTMDKDKISDHAALILELK